MVRAADEQPEASVRSSGSVASGAGSNPLACGLRRWLEPEGGVSTGVGSDRPMNGDEHRFTPEGEHSFRRQFDQARGSGRAGLSQPTGSCRRQFEPVGMPSQGAGSVGWPALPVLGSSRPTRSLRRRSADQRSRVLASGKDQKGLGAQVEERGRGGSTAPRPRRGRTGLWKGDRLHRRPRKGRPRASKTLGRYAERARKGCKACLPRLGSF